MADDDQAQEKTEDATPKRLEKAKEEGQVARSRELGTTLILLGGTLSIWMLGDTMVRAFSQIMHFNLAFDRASAMDPTKMFSHLGASFMSLVGLLSILLGIMLLMGVLANILFGGFLLSVKPLQPRLNRLNPISGLKRMFSMNSLVELLKAIAKFLLVATVAILILFGFEDALISLGREGLKPALSHASLIILWSALGLAAATAIIALVDVPFQQFEFKKNLKMTRQQVKDELKDSEGRPEVRARVRQIQRQLATSRMMAEIPEADVVITNPEHFAIALKYQTEEALAGSSNAGGAPRVVAKGQDQLALKIREIAEHHGICLLYTSPSPRDS